MGEVVKVHFTPEQQDLVGVTDILYEAAVEETISSIAYVIQMEDGSYEMSWAGDITFHSAIDALKVLIRAMRKQMRAQDHE